MVFGVPSIAQKRRRGRRNDDRDYRWRDVCCNGAGMSEVTTLKQLMLDAAKYRKLREMVESGDYWLTRHDMAIANSGAILDEEIDRELDREP